jgi:hypothetical protein
LEFGFSYWIDNLGFVTEGKLAAIFIKPSLGVSNWPVIYFINYMPTSSLALFNTAPPQTGEIDNLIVSWEQSSCLCCMQIPRCCLQSKAWTRRLINCPELPQS